MMRAKFVLRVRMLSVFVILIAFLLIVRLYFIQIVHGSQYTAQALGQYVANTGQMPDRGNIFFTQKDGQEVAAAVMQGGWRIALNPALLKDANAAYVAL